VPATIDRDGVRRLVAGQSAQLVEVLPAKEYEEEHLPGAISIPLKEFNQARLEELDRNRAVIVYCWDNQCDLSPRAAARLETLSFREVYDYVAGKADWLAAGLPSEGTQANSPRAGDVAREVPTCRPDETVAEASDRARAAGSAECIVTNNEGVVLGRLRSRALGGDPHASVESVAEPGPSTIRPDVSLDEIVKRLRENDLGRALVTTGDGILVGVLHLDEAERHLATPSAAVTGGA
jgi:rhodanese-related sulfurtransferase/CBS domain-containing protein